MVIFYQRIIINGKPYIIAGFGEITKKKYLIKVDTQGREYIIFNMKKTLIPTLGGIL